MSEPTDYQTCHICGAKSRIGDRLGGWCEKHWEEAEQARHAEHKRLTTARAALASTEVTT